MSSTYHDWAWLKSHLKSLVDHVIWLEFPRLKLEAPTMYIPQKIALYGTRRPYQDPDILTDYGVGHYVCVYICILYVYT